MKYKLILSVFVWCMAATAFAQSKTTEALDNRFEGLSLFFYKNTLRMLNQAEDKNFDELIKNVEKMKFLMIDRSAKFSKDDYKKLVSDYQAEAFEPAMISRFEGKSFDVYVRDKKDTPLSTVVLVGDSTRLFVLDMIGTIDVRKASALFTAIDENTDIGKQIKNFTNGKDKNAKAKH
jgi:Domain of unknown function (DUF4252)